MNNITSTPRTDDGASPLTAPLLPYAAWLPQEICNRAIPIPSKSPPAEVIPWVQKFIKRHEQIGQLIPLNTHDRPAWQALMDDWQSFSHKLEQTIAAEQELKASKNRISASESGKNSEPPRHQQTSTRNEPGMNPEQPGIARNEAGKPRNHDGITRNESETIGNEAAPSSCPSFPSVKNPQTPISDPHAEPEEPKSDAPDPQSAIPNPKSEEFHKAAAELSLRLKGRNRFDQLTTQQQDAIMDLLDIYKYSTVLELIAEPPPIGMSFTIGKSALFEFKTRYRKLQAERRKKESTDQALELLKKSENPTAAFVNLYERLLQIKALTIASDTDATLAQLDQLTATITKLRKQSLAERKQRHHETK